MIKLGRARQTVSENRTNRIFVTSSYSSHVSLPLHGIYTGTKVSIASSFAGGRVNETYNVGIGTTSTTMLTSQWRLQEGTVLSRSKSIFRRVVSQRVGCGCPFVREEYPVTSGWSTHSRESQDFNGRDRSANSRAIPTRAQYLRGDLRDCARRTRFHSSWDDPYTPSRQGQDFHLCSKQEPWPTKA